jgi:hypothetical protein
MYVYLWEYRVLPEATAQFQEKYGAEGHGLLCSGARLATCEPNC